MVLVIGPTTHHQLEHVIGYLDRVGESLLECINIAENTLGKDHVSSNAKPRITRPHYPLSDDLLGQIDRVDDSLLECIYMVNNLETLDEFDNLEEW